MAELSLMADDFQVLQNANIPVLFRPLHEIDGGWFWWTDLNNPSNTVALWKQVYNYMVHTRGLHNLVWVWSSGLRTGLPDPNFYPGSNYVDIIGADMYVWEPEGDRDYFWGIWNALTAIDSSKMNAMCECGALPNPDEMQNGLTPPWLYALPWYGVGTYNTMANDAHNWLSPFMTTEDTLPSFSGLCPQPAAKLMPELGIVSPLDDGSARFPSSVLGATPAISVEASERDGLSNITHIDFYANGKKVGAITNPTSNSSTFTWATNVSGNTLVPVTAGTYVMYAVAYNNATPSLSATSQTVHVSYNVGNLALNCPVTCSVGGDTNTANLIDGSYWTTWNAGTTTGVSAWVYADLGSATAVGEVDLSFWWKLFADAYTIDVSTDATTWTTVARLQDIGDDSGNLLATQGSVYSLSQYPLYDFNKITFPTVIARYVRFSGINPVQGQTWGGYDFTAFEAPCVFGSVNHPPAITAAASADRTSLTDYYTGLHVTAADPDHDYLTYSWSVVKGNAANVSFSVNNSIFANNTTINLAAPGAYTVQVSVTDGRGGSTNSQVTVTQEAIHGGLLTDDCDSQGGAAGPELPAQSQAPISEWAQYCLRAVLQKGITIQKATLSVYVATSTSGLHATLYSGMLNGATDWSGAAGPVPAEGGQLGITNISATGGCWAQFDVTAYATDQAEDTGICTFVLAINDSQSWQTVYSLASQDSPKLTITTETGATNSPTLTGAAMLGTGLFQFAFSNNQGASFTVLSTTNVALPLTNWMILGSPTNHGSGLYQFTAPVNTNNSPRFYRVRSP
jgi:hypothetical protein